VGIVCTYISVKCRVCVRDIVCKIDRIYRVSGGTVSILGSDSSNSNTIVINWCQIMNGYRDRPVWVVTETELFEWLQRQSCLNGCRDRAVWMVAETAVWMVTEIELYDWLQRQSCMNGYRDRAVWMVTETELFEWLQRQSCLNGYRDRAVWMYKYISFVKLTEETEISYCWFWFESLV
jgi:hypothetical protein